MSYLNNKFTKLSLIFLGAISLIFVVLLVVPKYVLTAAAVIFLSVPYILGKGLKLNFDIKSIAFSSLISIVLIGIYLLLYVLIVKKSINYSVLSFALIFNHLVAISFPEEAFFRGYLQEELGNDLISIFIVSVLFALGHFITICAYSGQFGLHCVSALLTFLPSLVMGYLYYKTKSIWGSVIFHFLANISYLSTSGYSVFY